MDHGSKIMDQGSWTLDLGPCSGMNGHPGRDTDVRSRPSESTIIDLSFYIGFTRIQSRIKHLGPCFGTNGNFRRDPDVISRLPDTTIGFLSVFIGFRSSNRVKIGVLVQNTGFILILSKNCFFFNFYFVLGIILDHFRHPKSVFMISKTQNFMKKCQKAIDQKIGFL